MRIEVTIAKTTPLPPGAIDALASELSRRLNNYFLIAKIKLRFVMRRRTTCPLWAEQKKIKIASAKSCKKRGKAPTTGLSAIKNCSLIVHFLPGRPGFFVFLSKNLTFLTT
jgi:DNA-damage-inducible protein I